MEKLHKKILTEGRALGGNVLKVDSFLNHGVDSKLMYEIGTYFKEYYKDKGITKIFTIESSGIAPTVMTAMQMDLPMVTLKKQTSKILKGEVYQTTVHSFTKGIDYELTLSKNFINENDNVLIIDDFLANGEAALGAVRLVEGAGAKVGGIGIVIEKSFQPGRKLLDEKGYDVYSLARIKRLDKDIIEFVEE
ncbi:xanthine phosphoribosyltransferase [Clostridium paraputrificum]|uniref:xanthine phosphoribosyltransferase n=1 Tax=Clostridium TaxID=1485 RepID=UPI003D353B9F